MCDLGGGPGKQGFTLDWTPSGSQGDALIGHLNNSYLDCETDGEKLDL